MMWIVERRDGDGHRLRRLGTSRVDERQVDVEVDIEGRNDSGIPPGINGAAVLRKWRRM